MEHTIHLVFFLIFMHVLRKQNEDLYQTTKTLTNGFPPILRSSQRV